MSSEQRRAAFQRRDPNETSGSGKGGSTSDGGKVTSETPEELQKLRDLKSQSMDPKKVKADDNNAEHFTDTDVEDWVGDVVSWHILFDVSKDFGLEQNIISNPRIICILFPFLNFKKMSMYVH